MCDSWWNPEKEDLNKWRWPGGSPDCYVDFYDFSAIASEWMQPPPVQYDLGDDDEVNFEDLQRLSLEWLNCADPENPDCTTVP
jgi:hypothetical protein